MLVGARTTVALLACAITVAAVVWQSCGQERTTLIPLTLDDRFLEAVRQ
jgi:hypothetical protein